MLSKSTTQLIEQSFEDVGLSKEHARVYLKLLESGPTPASYIAKRARVPRSTAYGLLKDLIKVGLASSVKSEAKAIFMPSSPDQLQFLILQKSLQFQHHLKNLDKNLPELSTIFTSHQANFPSVRFFEGEKGLKTVLYDTFSAKELLWICQGSSETQKSLKDDPKYLKDYLIEAKRRKLKARELIEDTPAGREYKKKYGSRSVQVRLMSKRKVAKNAGFGHVDKAIYDGKITYISHDNLVGVIIEDETLASHEKLLFEDLWEKHGA